jgi:imidazolonepropionase
MLADLVVLSTVEVLTCAGPAPRCGAAQADASAIPDGAVAGLDGRIVFVGSSDECRGRVELAPGGTVVDAAGCTLVPGFVDGHTHVLYAGDRRHELRRRLAGASYAQIAAEGGGIVRTVDATRDATEETLADETLPRLHEMLRCGTTTCEVKSGYGLTVESELRMLRVMRQLAGRQPIDLVPTFMGAHEVPREFRPHRGDYVRHVIEDMLPAVASQGLAKWCDVFCEEGVFTPGESDAILSAGERHGLGLRIHANELGSSGGVRVAASRRVRSADHLVFLTADEIDALASAGTVATLLPSAAFYLKLGRFAPARQLIQSGVPVALASDVNPGGGFSPSLPFAMALACFGMGLTLEEALVGITLNAAYSLDVHDRVGSLERGKRFDGVLVAGTLVELVRVGTDAIRQVIKDGRIVHRTA